MFYFSVVENNVFHLPVLEVFNSSLVALLNRSLICKIIKHQISPDPASPFFIALSCMRNTGVFLSVSFHLST